jgi:NAD(P)-dependent dehydrogenase (short-subunit alcohol dehydrogenase family)
LTSSRIAEKGSEYTIPEDEKQILHNHEGFFERAGLIAKPEYYYNRLQDAEEMANVGVFLSSPLATSINGHVILADSGKTAAATGEGCTGIVPPIKPLNLS